MFANRITSKGSIAVLSIGFAAALGAGVGSSPTSFTSTHDVSAGTDARETLVLDFPFQGGHQRFIDLGKKGLSAGDMFLSTGQPILDDATGERIGSADGVELIVSKRHDGTVTSQSTLRLPGGHVELDGVVRHTDDPFRVTVTGGTGDYLGVGGQLTLIREDAERKLSMIKVELVR